MKRTKLIKQDNGPKNPRNRKEKSLEAKKFIEDCEQSLVRYIEQGIQKKEFTLSNAELEVEKRFLQLKRTYPNRIGHIATAVHNIKLAIKKMKGE
jgi:hypothetical protein